MSITISNRFIFACNRSKPSVCNTIPQTKQIYVYKYTRWALSGLSIQLKWYCMQRDRTHGAQHVVYMFTILYTRSKPPNKQHYRLPSTPRSAATGPLPPPPPPLLRNTKPFKNDLNRKSEQGTLHARHYDVYCITHIYITTMLCTNVCSIFTSRIDGFVTRAHVTKLRATVLFGAAVLDFIDYRMPKRWFYHVHVYEYELRD